MLPGLICHIQNTAGILVVLSGIVNFQFYAIMPISGAVENRCGLVIIVPNLSGRDAVLVTGITDILIIVCRVGIIDVDNAPAVLTGGIESAIAPLANMGVVISGIVASPDPLPAGFTDDSQFIQTEGT